MSARQPRTKGARARDSRVRWAALVATATGAIVGVATYLNSSAHELHDPNHGLQQLDLLYLDQPAPGRGQLGIEPGRPAVVVFPARAGAPAGGLPRRARPG